MKISNAYTCLFQSGIGRTGIRRGWRTGWCWEYANRKGTLHVRWRASPKDPSGGTRVGPKGFPGGLSRWAVQVSAQDGAPKVAAASGFTVRDLHHRRLSVDSFVWRSTLTMDKEFHNVCLIVLRHRDSSDRLSTRQSTTPRPYKTKHCKRQQSIA